MALRRSARARVPASESDAANSSQEMERRKRKRNTMTPETSQSPGKAGSPSNYNDADHHHNNNDSNSQNHEVASSSSPLQPKSIARKIVVKNTRKAQSDANESSDMSYLDVKTEEGSEIDLQDLYMSDDDRMKLETVLKV
jgi:hypothetical protein